VIVRQALIATCYALSTLCLIVLMGIGWVLAKLYRGRAAQEQATGNCWSYAVPRFLADPIKNALVVRLSPRAPVLHAQLLQAGALSEFVPVKPKAGIKAVLDSFWFNGQVRKFPTERTDA
jgi:hypothetical protein